MSGTVIFQPVMDWPLLAALGVVAALLLALGAWRDLRGTGLRVLALAALLLALANPVYRQEQRAPLGDVVFLVLDRTASQTLPERTQQLEAARAQLADSFSRLDPPPEVIPVIVRDATGSDSPRGTLLLRALDEAAAGVAPERIAGAVLVSDARIHDPRIPAGFPAPVHLLQTGRKGDWDRRITLENTPAYGIVGEDITVDLRIEDSRPAENTGVAKVYFTIDDGITRTARLKVGETTTLTIPVAHAGENIVQIRIDKLFGELTDRNNSVVYSFNGIRDRLRVLLVSGVPYAGERTWRNLLKADPAVDLVHFTILRAPDKSDGVPSAELSLIAFPTRELFMDKIGDFDLIIFDRYRRQGILPNAYLQNIVRYVEGGGALLVAAGPGFAGVESLARSPIGAVLPAAPTGAVLNGGYRPLISPLGQRHPVTRGLDGGLDTPDWGRWFRQIALAPRGGDVVMTGREGLPLLLLDRVQKGRVALLASDQAWLWSRGVEGGGPQAELLRRLAHWLMQEPELEENTLHATARDGRLVITRSALQDVPPEVEITAPSGEIRTVLLQETGQGRWQVEVPVTENGLFHIRNGDLETLASVGPAASVEFAQPVGGSPELLEFAKATGGGVFPLYEGTPEVRRTRMGRIAAGDGWLGLPARNAYSVENIRLTPLAPGWLLLLLQALSMGLAWWREGR